MNIINNNFGINRFQDSLCNRIDDFIISNGKNLSYNQRFLENLKVSYDCLERLYVLRSILEKKKKCATYLHKYNINNIIYEINKIVNNKINNC